MKKLLTLFEELLVAVAFAEAGEYDSLHEHLMHIRREPDARIGVAV